MAEIQTSRENPDLQRQNGTSRSTESLPRVEPIEAEDFDPSLSQSDDDGFDSRENRIAKAAYWRAEKRGFEPGNELDDWLAAEREIDTKFSRTPSGDRQSS